MRRISVSLLIFLSLMFLTQAEFSHQIEVVHAQMNQNTVAADDLIALINGWRTTNGFSALVWDASLAACAQNTANTMAANGMSWHIGNASGRCAAFGYNNGNTSYVTENFMTGPADISAIASTWSDASHMLPATNGSYCHVGAAVSSEVNGKVYYVLQAGYPAGSKSCAFSSGSSSSASSSSSGVSSTVDVSQIISSIQISTPNSSGQIWHEVQQGQTLWSIATAYETTVGEICTWNGINERTALSLGEKLRIPDKDNNGSIPTPDASATVYPTADADGNFFHIVSSGDTLYGISSYWKATLSTVLSENGLTSDSTIGLGWDLKIPITATASPLPSNTPEPSFTPSPIPSATQTAMPSPSVSPTNENQPTNALRLPRATTKTYIIAGISGLILLAVILLMIESISKKK